LKEKIQTPIISMNPNIISPIKNYNPENKSKSTGFLSQTKNSFKFFKNDPYSYLAPFRKMFKKYKFNPEIKQLKTEHHYMNEDCIVNLNRNKIVVSSSGNKEKLNKKLSLDRKKLLIKKQLNTNSHILKVTKNEPSSQSALIPQPPPLTPFLNGQNVPKQNNQQIKTKQRRLISNRIRTETSLLLNNVIFDSMLKNNNLKSRNLIRV
jgi:hypothetical protein